MNLPTIRRLALATCLLAAVIGTASSSPTAQASGGDAVLGWNATAGAAARAACLSPANDPLHEARMYAMAHIAVHDALNAIDRRYEPYAYDATAPRRPRPPRLPSRRQPTTRSSPCWPTSRASCSRPPVVPLERPSSMPRTPLRWRQSPTTPPSRPGSPRDRPQRRRSWQRAPAIMPTTPRWSIPHPEAVLPACTSSHPAHRTRFAPKWGAVTPFVLADSTQFASGPPYPLSSKRYADDLNEVKRLGGVVSERSAEQTEIALFWVESSPLAWNRMARTIAADRGVDLWDSARLFALLNMGLTDGYIGSFQEKYVYNFWRPVTAIQRAAEDGNPATSPDPLWQPLLTTPPIPDHDSAHSVEGAVAATIMQRVFGTDKVSFAVCSLTLPAGQTCDDPSPVYARVRSALGRGSRERRIADPRRLPLPSCRDRRHHPRQEDRQPGGQSLPRANRPVTGPANAVLRTASSARPSLPRSADHAPATIAPGQRPFPDHRKGPSTWGIARSIRQSIRYEAVSKIRRNSSHRRPRSDRRFAGTGRASRINHHRGRRPRHDLRVATRRRRVLHPTGGPVASLNPTKGATRGGAWCASLTRQSRPTSSTPQSCIRLKHARPAPGDAVGRSYVPRGPTTASTRTH